MSLPALHIQLREALDRKLAAKTPEERERTAREFHELVRSAFKGRREQAPDWQRAAAGDPEE